MARDRTLEKVIEKTAKDLGEDKRVIRIVVYGFYNQVKRAMEEGDMYNLDTYTSISLPGLGQLRPKKKQTIINARIKRWIMLKRHYEQHPEKAK